MMLVKIKSPLKKEKKEKKEKAVVLRDGGGRSPVHLVQSLLVLVIERN